MSARKPHDAGWIVPVLAPDRRARGLRSLRCERAAGVSDQSRRRTIRLRSTPSCGPAVSADRTADQCRSHRGRPPSYLRIRPLPPLRAGGRWRPTRLRGFLVPNLAGRGVAWGHECHSRRARRASHTARSSRVPAPRAGRRPNGRNRCPHQRPQRRSRQRGRIRPPATATADPSGDCPDVGLRSGQRRHSRSDERTTPALDRLRQHASSGDSLRIDHLSTSYAVVHRPARRN